MDRRSQCRGHLRAAVLLAGLTTPLLATPTTPNLGLQLFVEDLSDTPMAWSQLPSEVILDEYQGLSQQILAQNLDPNIQITYTLDDEKSTCREGWDPTPSISREGWLSGFPTAAAVGTCQLHLVASSGEAGPSVEGTITIKVEDVDLPPTWVKTVGDFKALEDYPLPPLSFQASDLDHNISYSLNPISCSTDWDPVLSISKDGLLSGTPRDQAPGTCVIQVLARGGTQEIQHLFKIDIINTEDPPQWQTEFKTMPISMYPIDLQATAVDPDLDDRVTYNLDLGRTTCHDAFHLQLTIDPLTGELKGTPKKEVPGGCQVTVIATSGDDSISGTWTLIPTLAATPPVWDLLIEPQEILEDQALSGITAQASRPAGSIVYQLGPESTCGPGFSPALRIDPATGEVTGTPTDAAVGPCTIQIQALSDGHVINQSFLLNVISVDDPLEWVYEVEDQVIDEDAPLEITVEASDEDDPQIHYSIGQESTCFEAWSPAPTIDPLSGTLTGTPIRGDIQPCDIKVVAQVFEKGSGSILESNPDLSIPDGGGPVIDQQVITAHPYTIDNTFKVDIEITHTFIGDLEVTLISPTGKEVVLHRRSGGSKDNLIGTYPTTLEPAEDLGVLANEPANGEWQLKVEDKSLADTGTLVRWKLSQEARLKDSISQTFRVEINPVDDPLIWQDAPAEARQDEGQPIRLEFKAYDEDSDEPPTYTINQELTSCALDAWPTPMAIDPESGAVFGVPGPRNIGTCEVTVEAFIGDELIQHQLPVHVNDVDTPPMWLKSIDDFQIKVGQSIEQQVIAFDYDLAQEIIYSIEFINCAPDIADALRIDDEGTISGTPPVSGSCAIEVQASSGNDLISQSLRMVVRD